MRVAVPAGRYKKRFRPDAGVLRCHGRNLAGQGWVKDQVFARVPG